MKLNTNFTNHIHEVDPETRAYNAIPRYALGEAPEDMEPKEYRCTIAKRALEAGYEEVTLPDTIVDILADIRHLCDTLGLDYAFLDKQAYLAYLKEKYGEAVLKNFGKQ